MTALLPTWWQAVVAVAAAACVVPYVCARIERRLDRKMREHWARMPGATR